LLVKKQEMTKIWNNNQFVPVTIAQIVPQEVVRMKTLEKDGYQAVVVGVGKKELTTKLKGNKISWQRMVEFSTTQTYLPGVHLD
jgi:large subunit ribosomal protein L3